MYPKTNIRPLKAAKLKLAILQATIDLIGGGSFKYLHINDLCNKVNISKVTLFKYFPQKEDILLYYMRIWTFHRAVEMRNSGKNGITGIFFLADKLSHSFERNPGLTMSFIANLANTQVIQKPFPVKEDEKRILELPT